VTALPEGWEFKRLGELVKVSYGKGLRASARSGTGEVPVIGSSGVVGTHDVALVEAPVVVVGRKGNVGAAFLADKPSWPIDTTYYLSVPSNIDPKFLTYQINHLALEGRDSSTAVPSLRRPDLESAAIALPPLEAQARIVEAIEEQFSRLDAAVESLRGSKIRISSLRTALLKAAVEGRMFSTDETHFGIGKNDARTEPNLPSGWRWVTVGEIATRIEYGSSAKANVLSDGGVPVVRMGNVVDGTLDMSNLKYLPRDHPDVPRFSLKEGDLLFNRTNSPELVGKTAVFKGRARTVFASYLIRVSFQPHVNPQFVAHVINSPYGRAHIARIRSQQVGQANVNGSKLRALPIPLPPLSEQVRIVAELERQFSIIDAMAKTIDAGLQRAAALRQSILSRAFSGDLTKSSRLGTTLASAGPADEALA
jgi:type I restriction enzyme S subunit